MAGSGASTPYSRPQKSSSSSSSKSKSKQMPTDRKRKRSRVDIDIDPAGSVIPAGSDLEEKTDIDRHKARKPFSTMDNLGLPRSRITDTIPTASITTIIPPSSAPVDTADNGEIDIEDLFGPEPDIDIVNPSSGPATTSKQFDNSSGKLDVDVENGQTSTSTSTSTSFLEPSYSYSDMDTDNYYGSTYASDNIDIDIDSRFKRPTINNLNVPNYLPRSIKSNQLVNPSGPPKPQFHMAGALTQDADIDHRRGHGQGRGQVHDQPTTPRRRPDDRDRNIPNTRSTHQKHRTLEQNVTSKFGHEQLQDNRQPTSYSSARRDDHEGTGVSRSRSGAPGHMHGARGSTPIATPTPAPAPPASPGAEMDLDDDEGFEYINPESIGSISGSLSEQNGKNVNVAIVDGGQGGTGTSSTRQNPRIIVSKPAPQKKNADVTTKSSRDKPKPNLTDSTSSRPQKKRHGHSGTGFNHNHSSHRVSKSLPPHGYAGSHDQRASSRSRSRSRSRSPNHRFPNASHSSIARSSSIKCLHTPRQVSTSTPTSTSRSRSGSQTPTPTPTRNTNDIDIDINMPPPPLPLPHGPSPRITALVDKIAKNIQKITSLESDLKRREERKVRLRRKYVAMLAERNLEIEKGEGDDSDSDSDSDQDGDGDGDGGDHTGTPTAASTPRARRTDRNDRSDRHAHAETYYEVPASALVLRTSRSRSTSQSQVHSMSRSSSAGSSAATVNNTYHHYFQLPAISNHNNNGDYGQNSSSSGLGMGLGQGFRPYDGCGYGCCGVPVVGGLRSRSRSGSQTQTPTSQFHTHAYYNGHPADHSSVHHGHGQGHGRPAPQPEGAQHVHDPTPKTPLHAKKDSRSIHNYNKEPRSYRSYREAPYDIDGHRHRHHHHRHHNHHNHHNHGHSRTHEHGHVYRQSSRSRPGTTTAAPVQSGTSTTSTSMRHMVGSRGDGDAVGAGSDGRGRGYRSRSRSRSSSRSTVIRIRSTAPPAAELDNGHHAIPAVQLPFSEIVQVGVQDGDVEATEEGEGVDDEGGGGVSVDG